MTERHELTNEKYVMHLADLAATFMLYKCTDVHTTYVKDYVWCTIHTAISTQLTGTDL
jgi:hypothetical protein